MAVGVQRPDGVRGRHPLGIEVVGSGSVVVSVEVIAEVSGWQLVKVLGA